MQQDMNRQLNLTVLLCLSFLLYGCASKPIAPPNGAAYDVGMAQPAPILPPAVDARRVEISGRAGRLSYYVAGEGPPLLLIHSINAAGSAYEVKPIFEHFAGVRRVYALDLPGFGFSDRSPRTYDMPLYVAAIRDMIDVVQADGGGPFDALAISLSAEFLARAATERPEAFRSLALVSPTGFDKGSADRRGPPGATREVPLLYGVVAFPLWSQGLFDLLVSRRSIRYFLGKTFGSDDIDEGLAEYDYATAHQPGARYAPLAFVSGRLFSADIRTVYERLAIPVWAPHGNRGDFTDYSETGWAEARGNWELQTYDTGALPHFEVPAAFLRDYERFLDAAAQASSSGSSSPMP